MFMCGLCVMRRAVCILSMILIFFWHILYILHCILGPCTFVIPLMQEELYRLDATASSQYKLRKVITSMQISAMILPQKL